MFSVSDHFPRQSSDLAGPASASLLTGISRLTKKEPPLRMYSEQARTMNKGIHADGSKAERELGISYTPVRLALEEELTCRKSATAEMV